MSNKIEWADGIRGLAAITVILQHFVNTFFPQMNGPFLPEGAHGVQFMTYPLLRSVYAGNFSVHVFFVLSGIVVPYRYLSKGSNDISIVQSSLIRRVPRLFVPIVPLSIISYVMYMTGAYSPACDMKFLGIMCFKSKFRSFGQFLLDTFIGIWMTDGDTYIPVAWTLSYEMMGSILLYVVLFGGHGLHPKFNLWFIVALSTAFGVASSFYGIMLIYYHDFLVGLLIAKFILWKSEQEWTNSWKEKFCKIFGFFLFISGLFFGSYPLFIDDEPSYWAGMKQISDATVLDEKFWYTIGGTLTIFAIALSQPLQWFFSLWVFKFIGKISYPLYLIHLQLMASGGAAIFKGLSDKLSYGGAAFTMFIIYLCVLFPLSYLGVHFLDVPSIECGRWLEKKVRKPLPSLPVSRL